jgi:type VII secretion-associated protein (TIGR03931 family)
VTGFGAVLLPMPPPRRRARPVLCAAAVVLAAGALAGGLAAAVPHPPAAPRGADPPARLLAQYDYALTVPEGWRHSGGLPERRRTLLTPAATPDGSDLVAVEQTPLGYDTAAEPDRAYRELRDRVGQARAAGEALDELTLSTRVAGRDVIGYRQRRPGAEVDWYVLFTGDQQLSVGCQHTPAGAAAVRAACATVVGSLTRR